MEFEHSPSEDERRIRTLVEHRSQAVRDRDLQGILGSAAPGMVTFDVLPPLCNVGAEAVRERTRGWLDGYADGPGYEVRDLRVAAGHEVAFAHYLYRISGTLKSGGEVRMWVRCTLGLRKTEGEWCIVHEHDSVPFDPESGRAVLDLQP